MPRAELSAGVPHAGPFVGCWCPKGRVLGSEGQCVWPWQCPCLVDGVRYWPGQHIKADYQLCICQDGQPGSCRPNPDCAREVSPLALTEGSHPARHPPLLRPLTLGPFSVNCGWLPWSPWAECLGPCGGHSIQWSFRSPSSPHLSGPVSCPRGGLGVRGGEEQRRRMALWAGCKRTWEGTVPKLLPDPSLPPGSPA